MKHEIDKIPDHELAELLTKQEIGEVIKPLTNEIFLKWSFVAGTYALEDSSVLETIQPGDTLLLSKMKYDPDFYILSHRVKIETTDGKYIGLIPEKDSEVFYNLLGAGKRLIAKVMMVSKGYGLYKINIRVYMIDF